MDSDESRSSSSLDYSDDMMIVTEEEEALDSNKKRKQRADEFSDLLPLPKHFCLKLQQASLLHDSSCPSSDIESGECSYAMEDIKTGNENSPSTSCSTGSSSSGSVISNNIDQYYSKVKGKTQEDVDVEDLTLLEFICPEFAAVEEVLNPVGSSSYVLSSARWSVSNQGSEDEEKAIKKPTIDLEFEDYFSELMM